MDVVGEGVQRAHGRLLLRRVAARACKQGAEQRGRKVCKTAKEVHRACQAVMALLAPARGELRVTYSYQKTQQQHKVGLQIAHPRNL